VKIHISPPIPLADFADRKELARYTENAIRQSLARLLRGQKIDDTLFEHAVRSRVELEVDPQAAGIDR